MSETEINNIFKAIHVTPPGCTRARKDVAIGDLLEGSDDAVDDVIEDSLRNEIRRVLKSLSPAKQNY